MTQQLSKSLFQTRVIVGMSGGVDSSVAALRLLQQGYQVEGLFMKNWEEDDGSKYCTAMTDLADAQQVCDRLGITLHKANFAAEYWDNVFTHFLKEYRQGRTPNPDVLCNKAIKFKAFLDYALTMLNADYIATGHYARRVDQNENTLLCKSVDDSKDQTYFLYAVGAVQLAKTLFPIGSMTKTVVRKLAKQHQLITHDKKDSTGICFIGERRFNDFLKQYLPAQAGAIETTDGCVIGEHQGLMYHTIGQRQGLGIGGLKNANEAPWYVIDKNLDRNVLIVGQGNDHPLLFSEALTIAQIDWIAGAPPELPKSLAAKIRHRQQDQLCQLSRLDNGHYLVRFATPQRAVAPGQSVVFYNGTVCLGGGVIDARYASFGSDLTATTKP